MTHEHLHRWYSPALSRNIEVLAFGHRGYPIILFPTSMGRFYENKDFKLIESVSWFLDEGLVKIYCPDGIDSWSWYNKSIAPADRVKNHIWYDQMLVTELVPLAQRETGVGRVATAGCSFGGCHLLPIFAFKHPEVVKYVFTMGAAFDIKINWTDITMTMSILITLPILFPAHRVIFFRTCLSSLAQAVRTCAGMRTKRWLAF